MTHSAVEVCEPISSRAFFSPDGRKAAHNGALHVNGVTALYHGPFEAGVRARVGAPLPGLSLRFIGKLGGCSGEDG